MPSAAAGGAGAETRVESMDFSDRTSNLAQNGRAALAFSSSETVTVDFGEGDAEIITGLSSSNNRFDIAKGLYLVEISLRPNHGSQPGALRFQFVEQTGSIANAAAYGEPISLPTPDNEPTDYTAIGVLWLDQDRGVRLRVTAVRRAFSALQNIKLRLVRWGGVAGPGGDGSSFVPTQQNLYDAVKAILHPSTNAGVTADDANDELDIPAPASWAQEGQANPVTTLRDGVDANRDTLADLSDAIDDVSDTVPAKATTSDADSVAQTGTALSASLTSRSGLNDVKYMSLRMTLRVLQRVLKTASTTVRGAVLLARNADVDSSETDTSRVLTVASAKRLIARVAPATSFTPTKANLYAAVKEILVHSGSPGATADDTNSEIDIAGGGSTPPAGTHNRLIGWSAGAVPTQAEINAAELETDDVLTIPSEASSDKFLFFGVITGQAAPTSALFDGNSHDILGGFTKRANQARTGTGAGTYQIWSTNSTQNGSILGTGSRTLTLRYT